MTILSEMERKFAAAYVANGGIAARAAIAAGYSPIGARQLGSRLLKRFRVREEIARLTGAAPPPKPEEKRPPPPIRGKVIVIAAPPLEGEVLPAAAPIDDDKALAARLTPEWIIARAMRSAMICAGEIPQTLVKMVSKTDANGVRTITAVQVKAFMHDAAGLISSLSLLAKASDLRVPLGAAGDGEEDVAKLPHRQRFEEKMAEFARVFRARQAQQAERAARFNSTSGVRSEAPTPNVNGQTRNGNGSD